MNKIYLCQEAYYMIEQDRANLTIHLDNHIGQAVDPSCDYFGPQYYIFDNALVDLSGLLFLAVLVTYPYETNDAIIDGGHFTNEEVSRQLEEAAFPNYKEANDVFKLQSENIHDVIWENIVQDRLRALAILGNMIDNEGEFVSTDHRRITPYI